MSETNGQHLDPAAAGLSSLPLPPGWARATVGELGDVRLGRQRSPKNRSGDNPTKYIRAANIRWDGLDLTDVLEMEFRPEEMEAYRLRPGDVLLSEASGSSAEVGKPVIWNGEIEDCCFQNTVVRFRPHSISTKFAHLAFQHYARNGIFSGCSKGVGIQHLSADRFSVLPLLLPPAGEQARIIAKAEELLSELDAGVAALKRAHANLKRYRLAVLKAAVEGRLTEAWRADHNPSETGAQLLGRILKERRRKWEEEQLAYYTASEKQPPKGWQAKYKEPAAPDTNDLSPLPTGWCWASIDQLHVRLKNGYFQSPTHAEDGIPILRINAVRPMSVDLTEARFLGGVGGEVDDYCIADGDLLFTRYNGSIDLLGVAGMVRGCTSKIVHPDKLIRVCLALGSPLPNYVEIAANAGESRRHMAGRARTTAGQTGISGTDVREMPLPLPPLVEQAEIVESVEQAISAIRMGEAEVERSLARAARLRQSILRQAFEGKLVAQDAADESASVLLARIRQQRMAVPSRKAGGAEKPMKIPREVFLRRASIVSYTVRRLSAHRSFGRTQLEKTVHLTQSHLGVDLGFVFERYAAGPFDKSIYKLEGVARKNDWFTTQNRPTFGVTYHPGPKIDQMCQYAPGHLGDRQPALDRLLDHIAGMNTDEAELFATAYAAWNDLLIYGRPADDGAIIAEVHGWHEEKKRFQPETIRARLVWMRENGYVPTGQGQRTRLVEKATKLNSRRRRKGDASA